ncbi:hypothetical protein BX661DRAFT_195797 [Kickxella alabastrina]|uniref:uncharacterized protein n=1 Tax=Kickxella alabastrina TaxID=61397 RepID=UPI002220B885|nr:uncharacterized protein BX661DRAFT_195797 [Kickxella alabastrina]KAI7834024.1 hypothetical protein BX661DRAFT_195797 [Kickxella alabastrina]
MALKKKSVSKFWAYSDASAFEGAGQEKLLSEGATERCGISGERWLDVSWGIGDSSDNRNIGRCRCSGIQFFNSGGGNYLIIGSSIWNTLGSGGGNRKFANNNGGNSVIGGRSINSERNNTKVQGLFGVIFAATNTSKIFCKLKTSGKRHRGSEAKGYYQ